MTPSPTLFRTYQPFARQAEFHRCKATYRLFGGAAGPGKSRALLEEAVARCLFKTTDGKLVPLKDAAGLKAVIIRTTGKDLEDSIISVFRDKMNWREIGAKFNEQEKVVRWPNKAILRFGHCANEKEFEQYLGGEYAFIGIDELTLFPTVKIWQKLTSRLRSPIAGIRPRMAATSNPGNVGHEWVKALFVEKRPAPGMEPHEYDPADYEFIPAKYLDGPYADDAEYRAKLEKLPSMLRRAWLDGDWSIAAGSYFDIWNVDAMTVAPGVIGMQSWWPRWISIDWGFGHHASVHWHTVTPQNSEGRRTVITYRELVTQSELFPKKLGPRDLGRVIAEKSKYRTADGAEEFENIDEIYISPDAKQKRTDEDSILDQITQSLKVHGLAVTPELADNDRVGGWMLMYELLRDGEWKICTSCPEAIRAIPAATRDPDFIEDVLKTATIADDVNDDLRYGLKSRLKNRKVRPPLAVRVHERMAGYAEERHTAVENLSPNTIAFLSRKAERMERPKRTFHRFRPGQKRGGGGGGSGFPGSLVK